MNRESIKSICVGKDVFFRSNLVPKVYVHSYFKDNDPYVEILDEETTYLSEYQTVKKSRNIFDYLFNITRPILILVFIIIGIKDKSFQFTTLGVFMILPYFRKGWELLHKVINVLFRRKLFLCEYRLQSTLSTFEMLLDKKLRIPTFEDVKNAPPSDSYTEDINGMFYLLTFILVALDIIFVYPNMQMFWIIFLMIFATCLYFSDAGIYDRFQKLLYQEPTEESYNQILACMKAWTQLEESFQKMEREQGYIAIVFEHPEENQEQSSEDESNKTDGNKPKE